MRTSLAAIRTRGAALRAAARVTTGAATCHARGAGPCARPRTAVWLAALSLAAFAPLAPGCAAPADEVSGTLEIPLSQPGPDGALYQLAASFRIDGPGGATQILDGTVAAPSLEVMLPPGIATITLLDGWTLARSIDGGATFEPVSALLGTANPFPVRILANQPLSLSYDFLIRNQTGDLTVSFSVSPAPRELAGGIFVATATGDFAAYAGARFDFALFYDLDDVLSVTEGDARLRSFESTRFAAEFYNDPVGLLAGTVAPGLAGGFVQYQVAVQLDGTQVVSGGLSGANEPTTTLQLGPHTLSANLPLDADGFVVDQRFADTLVPYTLTTRFGDGDATLTGTVNIRFIPSRAGMAN